jgi:Domain of unknown function (DUF4132)
MAGSFFNRLLGGLRAASGGMGGSGSGDLPMARINAYFAPLAKEGRDLPAGVQRYIAEGDNTSIILKLQQTAIQQAWNYRQRAWPDRDGEALLARPDHWRIDQMQRLGEVLAALNPLSHDWGFYGTRKSPDWLRHVVSLWLPRDRKAQPLSVLGDLAAQSGDAIAPVLDIVFTRDPHNYQTGNSVARFTGLGEWLVSSQDAIIAAAPNLAADVRAELASSMGRLGLQESYRELLIDLACGSAKKVRASARQALTACDTAGLTEALEARFAKAAPATRAELVAVATGALGTAAPALLARWRESETTPKVIAALDQAGGAIATAPPPPPAKEGAAMFAVPAHPDGPLGYTAVDGSWIDAGGPLTLPPPTKVPPEVLATLEPAVAEFNKLLAKGKAEGAWQRWHWSKQYSPKDKGTLAALGRLAEGTTPLIAKSYGPAVDWMQFYQFKHPAVEAFFHDPRLTLRHLTRYAVAMTNCHIHALFGDWSGPVGRAVQARLTDPQTARTFIAMWTEAGGTDFITGFLQSRWTWGGSLPDFGTPIFPTLCTRFDDLDQALGMMPQSATEPKLPQRGLELLEQFPILPNRYRNRAMVLAGDTAAKTRDAARALLKDTPGIDGAIAVQLLDGKQDVRALAAEWLASRDAKAELPAIRAALAKEKSDVARAAMITALQKLGDDVSHLFDPAVLVKEATAGLAKTKPKGLDWFPFDMVPQLHWADGTPVDPILPRWWITLAAKLKQPGGNALINLWLDRLAPGDAHKLGWMVLTGWIDEDTRRPSDAEANAYAAQHVDATLQQNIANVKRWPQSADYFLTDRTALFAQLKRQKASVYLGTASESKGILALAARVNGADAAQRIRPFLKDHGSRTSQAKALMEVLAAIGTSAALQVLLGAANRMKQRSVQDFAGALVDDIAARNGWTPAQLADRTVPTGGFDSDGSLELDCGEDRTYRLQLGAQDDIIILNPEGREVKALPAPRVDDEKPLVDAAKKLLSNARKEVKQVLTAQTARLQEAMFLQREWDVAEWESFLAGHPLVGRLAARLVWDGLGSEGQSLALFRPLGDGSYTDPEDNDVALADLTTVRLAHSSLLKAEAIAKWRQHLADYAVEAPFDQLGRDLPVLDVTQGKATDIKDREGWMIESFKLRGVATKLGYQRGRAEDGGWFYTYEKSFRDAGVMVVIEFTGSPLPEENQPSALIALSFRKLRGAISAGLMPLSEVPPVLLAESWRDLHDIADKGTGLDPEWKKKANHGY